MIRRHFRPRPHRKPSSTPIASTHRHKIFRSQTQHRTENEETAHHRARQIGTQLDAFAHQMYGDSFYNYFKLNEIATRNGFKSSASRISGWLMSAAC